MRTMFLAHPSEFTCNAMKAFAKRSEVDLYIWDDFNDFSYLVNDLKPEAIILHHEVLNSHMDAIEDGFSKADFKDYKLVSLGECSGLEFDIQLDHVVDPSTFFEQLLAQIS